MDLLHRHFFALCSKYASNWLMYKHIQSTSLTTLSPQPVVLGGTLALQHKGRMLECSPEDGAPL